MTQRMSRWWRAYDEALDDPKLQRLSPELFRCWFNLMCLTSQNGGTLPSMADIAYRLRMDEGAAKAAIEELQRSKLIDETDDETFHPHNWAKRQYKSDVSTERVKRFRKQHETVSETAPDTDTERKKESKFLVNDGLRPKKKVPKRPDSTSTPRPAEPSAERGLVLTEEEIQKFEVRYPRLENLRGRIEHLCEPGGWLATKVSGSRQERLSALSNVIDKWQRALSEEQKPQEWSFHRPTVYSEEDLERYRKQDAYRKQYAEYLRRVEARRKAKEEGIEYKEEPFPEHLRVHH